MEIEGAKVWQVAAGDTNRNYADICIYWNVILVGNGKYGKWPEYENNYIDGKINAVNIKQLYSEIKIGDLILLRSGTKFIYGIGKVVSDYQWLNDFGDIDGWDLQHTRRVKWLRRYDKSPKKFKRYTLKWGNTIQIAKDSDELREWITSEIGNENNIPLPELPKTRQDFIEPINLNAGPEIKSLIEKQREMHEWYDNCEIGISEADSIHHFILPLLRGLNWCHKNTAIEWDRIDIALFDNNEKRTHENTSMIIEAKKRWSSFLTAKQQAEEYAKNSPNCNRIVVTNGICYSIYLRENKTGFYDTPEAYLNVRRMLKSYPILGKGKNCAGANEAIRIMSQSWSPY